MATLSQPTGLMFGPNPNSMGGPPGPLYPGHPQQQYYHQQPAPRQRTAIACRYCRRRKIRCSGFETSPDGRCANCMRFNQECVFTPVSSQTQAFVPAHALVSQRTGAQVLYGPQGQPLPPGYPHQGHEYHAHGPDSHTPYRLPSPNAHVSGESYLPHDSDRNHGSSHSSAPPFGRRGSAGDFQSHYRNQPPSPSSHLPPPHNSYTPPPLQTTFTQGSAPHSAVPGSFYPTLPTSNAPHERQRPDSPGSSHRSSSEHPSVSPQPQTLIHPPMVRPRSTGPSSPGGQIPSMQIADLVNAPPAPSHMPRNRHAADGDMLSRLNSKTGL